jgi:hypothetical protein
VCVRRSVENEEKGGGTQNSSCEDHVEQETRGGRASGAREGVTGGGEGNGVEGLC